MLNTRKLTAFGSIALNLLATSAMAGGQQGKGPGFSPVIEIAVGGETNSTGIYSPCVAECGGVNRGKQVRGGGLIRFGFKGIQASELMQANGNSYKVMFLPISMTVDMSGAQGDAFGHVVGVDGRVTRIRQVTGALVEAVGNVASGHINLRGKVLRADYNRDKGTFDWRALDASVGVEGAVELGSNAYLNVAVDVGGGVGGVKLNSMEELSAVIGAAPVMDGAYTLNPYAAIRTGLYSSSIKVELIASAERRIDLTDKASRTMYNGRAMSVDSVHANGKVEVEYTFGDKGLAQMGRRFSIFADATYDFDTLTLSDMAFGSDDTFRSFIVMGGVRAQF